MRWWRSNRHWWRSHRHWWRSHRHWWRSHRHWWRNTCTGGTVPALVAHYRHWWRSTSTGGAVPALVAHYRHWWRTTSTGGAVPALVAQLPALVSQCVKGLLPQWSSRKQMGPWPQFDPRLTQVSVTGLSCTNDRV
jgi:hypothetical protein